MLGVTVLASLLAITMDVKRTEIGSQSEVWGVAFAGESQVVGGYRNGELRRWNIEDGQQQGPTMRAGGSVWSVVVSHDGRWIVTGDDRHKAILWNAATHEKVREFREHSCIISGVDISSDGTQLATADWSDVQIFSISSGERLLPRLPHSHVDDVKFSPDGTRFAAVSGIQGFRVYSTDNGGILFDSGESGDLSQYLATPLVWSSDGQQLFVANKGKIICHNLSRSFSAEWSIHENQSPVFIASDGRFIACAAGSSVSLWDCMSHKQIGKIISHTAKVECVALSPSGRYLACGNSKNITIHDLRDVLSLEYIIHSSCALHNTLICRQLCASQLPLVEMGTKTFRLWMQNDPMQTELLLSEEIASTSSPSHYVLANRALIRIRLKHLSPAIEDVKESLRIRQSPIGHIVMAVALLAQGDREGALCTFDLAFHDCEPRDIRFLLLLKYILVFESGNQEDAIIRVEYLATIVKRDDDDDATYLYSQVLAAMYTKKGDYRRAISLIEHTKNLARMDKECPPLVTISLMFGWSFDGLDAVARQRLCETLYAEKCVAEAVEILLDIIGTSDKEIREGKANVGWVEDFTKKCAATLEHIGDEAFGSAQHDDAITQYSAALSLKPPSPAGLFLKRSRTRAAKGLWENALQDANEAVKVDPSNPLGHEAKHAALHGAQRYDEAIDAFKSMLHVIEQSHDPVIRELRKNYISPSEIIATIDLVVHGILRNCPLVVIDVNTGCLCDGPERMCLFKAHPLFKELVSSMTRGVENEPVLRVVSSFFEYVMLSHVWQGLNEPSFQDIKVEFKSVWDLPDTPLNEKLRNFCQETRRLGYRWAWSDTCCIDKSMDVILNHSLMSMYKWYADSAATLVFLADVAHPSKPRDLAHSVWMTRAWTLQELLAPNVIFFYDSEWEPYLGDTDSNHKESPEIMEELADAIKVSDETIVTFSPDDLGVREKLRLASTRNATVEEDIAYSLIGVFKSEIRPHYDEGADALGHLLEEIVDRSGEVTVLAWSGKSSPYNSCLPASLPVYSQTPYSPPSLDAGEMETCITKLRDKFPREEARNTYSKINCLPPARFAARRLHLPCIVFSVRSLEKPCGGNEKLYRARVSGLGQVEFVTADQLLLNGTQKFIFAYPWIDHIRGPNGGVTRGDDSDSDEDVPSHAVHMAQVDNYTRALEMIARLGQPFNALLLVQQSNGTYKRVAADQEIVVSGLGTNITSKNIRVKVLEVL
ncbi:hypothetical protein F5J12DRAFT_346351 [Pisolithus orientalis]|uniref:uncharacterized protein n=1 Tax=Pisolithus orientalis TaxID=936130 RepID=UPI0022251A1D|nr:uncharacterized protein F5J12DRAFT_346351 [Pisolithus orientalis]KAI5996844.1 hypothetical protein F5J12DRAFT_346351 [Pisolithus orientalis]